MKSDSVHIGVDISKEKLDVYNPVTGQEVSVGNDPAGFRKVREMARKHKAVVCCEPTGSCDLDMVLFLQRAKVPVAYCDGYRVRHFALSTGEFSKNDRIDARMISRFADNTNVRILDEKDQDQLKLRNRWSAYRALIDVHVVLAQKACSEHDASVKALLESESKRLKRKANAVLGKCVEIVNQNPRMRDLLERFVLIDGIGDVTAMAVIVGIPELGTISDAAVSKLAGVAPMERQSGKTDHIRHIHGGRKDVRRTLYMAAIVAARSNHILSEYYAQLKQRMPGPKAAKWALVPVMRKLIMLMNRIARDPNFVPEQRPRIKKA